MSKADELYNASIEYSNKINAEDDLTSWSLSDAFIEGAKYRQSEIDTINNSVKIYNEVIEDQKREIDELRAEVNSNLKEKMYFNRMKEIVFKVAYDSEHYSPKTHEVLRKDALSLLDEYINQQNK